MELFECEISGTILHCTLFRCKINSSRLDFCKLMDNNEVKGSKITKTTISPSNYIENCYIDNPNETVEGKIQGGVIRKGVIGSNVEISKETLIVDAKGGGKKDTDSLSDAFNSK
jgi:hypothetical protein